MGIDPISFFDISIKEAKLIIKGYNNKQKENFKLQQMAAFNAYGSIMGGKKFKAIDPFNENNTTNKTSKEEKEETLNYLKNKFEGVI